MRTIMTMTSDANARLAPMQEFYAAMDRPLPPARWTAGEDVPQPARTLLVHEDDMTPTLEAYHGVELTLRPIDRHLGENTLSRMVLLEPVEGGPPVEFGMIRIHLDRFDDEAKREILECRTPLGTLINRRKIEHTCHPGAYFSLQSDTVLKQALGLNEPARLWGRCNILRDQAGQILAEVVEILPPATNDDNSLEK